MVKKDFLAGQVHQKPFGSLVLEILICHYAPNFGQSSAFAELN
jgi:hypothetical protein